MPLKKFILVIPSIDIKDGKTVRVVEGIPELESKEYGSDPVEMAQIWRAENAKILHVVDFDAAQEHSHKNIEIIEEICSSIIIPVEYAGGVRTMDDAKLMFDAGVSKLVISTMALENFVEFKKLFEKYGPSRIACGIDVIEDEIVIRSKNKKTGINYKKFVSDLTEIGAKRFIVTDVTKNGKLGGPNLELAKNVADISRQKVTIAGGIRNKDELIDIQNLIPEGIDSVIVGRALYENRFPCQKIWRIAEMGIFQ